MPSLQARVAPAATFDSFAVVLGDTPDEKRRVAMAWLGDWLTFRIGGGQRGVAVFDIDDTLSTDADVRIAAVCDVFDLCIVLHIPVYVITARPDWPENRKRTVKWLRDNKLDGYQRLDMMPRKDYPESTDFEPRVSKFKKEYRQRIGKEIIANIGDQWTDGFLFPLSRQEAEMLGSSKQAAIVFQKGSNGPFIKLPGR